MMRKGIEFIRSSDSQYAATAKLILDALLKGQQVCAALNFDGNLKLYKYKM